MAAAAFLSAISPAFAQEQTPPTGQAPPAAQAPSGSPYQVKLYDQDYTKGQPALPNIFKPYTQMRLPQQEVGNVANLDQLIRDGKLQLSLQDVVALALQNNLDISVQRWVTYQADAAVLGAKAGPGSVNPFGPFISFDPLLTSTIGWSRTSIPVNNGFLSGTGSTSSFTALTNQSTVGNFGYSQAFPTGTNFLVSLNNNRQSSTSNANFFNPSVNSSLAVQFQQPLLNGFGFTPNLRFLRVARNNRKIADLAFEQQVITTVSAVENQYYELVFAIEDVGVKEKSLALNTKLYNDNKRQVEIGTLAPIEITRAEAEVASATRDLINARTLVLQQATLLKSLIFRNVMDPKVAEIDVVPTDLPDRNVAVPSISLQDAVTEATTKRPDIRQAFIDLDSKKITTRATRNGLLPSLNLSAQYGAQGLAGNQLVPTFAGFTPGTSPIVDTAGNPVCPPAMQPCLTGQEFFTSSPKVSGTKLVQAGLGDALSNVFQSNFPNYSVSLNLNIPIRNRSAQSNNITALLAERQSEATLLRVRNAIAVDVRNAQILLEQDKAVVEANIRARILAEQTLDAEQKKFRLGASTIFLVIQAQRDLATARSNEVRAIVNLVEAKVNFDRALGRLLEVNRIDVADAKPYKIDRVPLIPGTPSAELAKTSSGALF
jgi:outer membrane protein